MELPLIKESEVNDICYKLCYACDEKISLDATDAEEILSLISKLISMNVDKRREEIEASIYECLGEASIIESLGEENVDETFVHYLTSTYAKVYEDVVTTHDFDSMGGNNTSSDTQSEDSKIPMEGLVISNELKNELKNIRKWEFNIVNLVPYTPYPLAVTVETALDELKLISDLELNESKLRRFMIAIQESYQDLPYHNYMHGADVTQTIFHMCTEGALMEALCVSNLGALAMIIGASIHDVGHPGVTGKFIVANSLPLAMQYNDQSPLENMHLATAFQLWNNQQNNFTEKMPRLLYKDLRKMIIDMVLATDNDMHFSLVGKLNEMISSGELSSVVQTQATAASVAVGTARSGTLGGSAMSAGGGAAGGIAPGGATAANQAGRTNRLHSTESQYSSMKRMQSERVAPGGILTGGTNTSLASTVFHRGSVNMSMEKLPINRKMSVTTGSNNATASPDGTPRGRTNRVASIMMNNSTTGESSAYLPMKAQQLFVLQVALHAADISGPAKPWEVHKRWTSLVMEEFYKQGDKERELNVPITFAFDRYNMVPMPKFQLGFIKAIVTPLYKSLAKISGLSLQPALECLESNSKKWESKIAP